jgi:hypothetical protein
MCHLNVTLRKAIVTLFAMPARRLEDQIRELCARVLYEKEPQWTATLRELQVAIQEHIRRISNISLAVTVAGKPEIARERRKT